MRSALDVMRDSVDSWIVNYGEYNEYPRLTIEAAGPQFMEFLEWLKRTPYKEYVHVPIKSVEEPKDEGISW